MDFDLLFDKGAAREGTNCVKWDGRERIFGRPDLIPLWVADMDFLSPDCVREELIRMASQGLYGYPDAWSEALEALCAWEKKRHAVTVTADQALLSPGVVDSLCMAVNIYTQSGDKVAIQPPVYGPFLHAVEDNGRIPYFNRLIQTERGWQMDLNDLEEGLKQGVKLLLLCSPHNPVGRIWTEEELRGVYALCTRYGCRVVCDEIHADFEMPGFKNTSMMKLAKDAVCFVSATKTFNLAGLRCSSMLFGNEADKKLFEGYMHRAGIGEVNLMGAAAQTAAYQGGEAWLDALIRYLDTTRAQCDRFCRENMPEFSFSRLEGTYLMWLDMRNAGLSQKELERKIVHEAGVALSSGTAFCPQGEGFMRVNIAAPGKNVMKAMENIAAAFHK